MFPVFLETFEERGVYPKAKLRIMDSQEDASRLGTSDLTDILKYEKFEKLNSLSLNGGTLSVELSSIISSILSKIPLIRCLSLDFKEFKLTNLRKLLNGVSRPPHLTVLEIKKDLRSADLKDLLNFPWIANVEKFVLPAYRQDSSYMSILLDVLSKMTNLRVLDLQNNLNLVFDLKRLGARIQSMTRLHELNLMGTVFERNHLSQFLTGMPGTLETLKKLYVDKSLLEQTHKALKDPRELLKEKFPKATILDTLHDPMDGWVSVDDSGDVEA